jgi:hypothetical protein
VLSPSLTSIAEDTARPAGDAVASLLGDVTDPDTGALKGAAVVGLTGTTSGFWQYSLNGGKTWKPLGDASLDEALLLRDTDKVRFVPGASFNGVVSLTFAAWDRTRGSAGGRADLALPSTTGGDRPFSTAVGTATLTVQPVHDAPVLNSRLHPTLPPVLPGATDPAGDTVASLLNGMVTDVDAGALQGIAVTSAPVTGGTWQLRLLGAATWTDVGAVSATSALLLRPEDSIRFLPAAGFSGTVTLGYRAWDQTAGTDGTKVVPGASTAFSKVSALATLTVTAQPLLSTAVRPALPPVLPGATDPAGVSVASVVGTLIEDAQPAVGIAVTGVTAGGKWQWFDSSTSAWKDVGTVSASAALLLRGQDLIRFVPDSGFLGKATLSFKAWDQTSGSAGTTANTAVGTAFSSAVGSLDTIVNTAPVLKG